MSRRCIAPERVEGNVSIGRCPNLLPRAAIVIVGRVPLTIWLCPEHHNDAFYPDPEEES